MSAHGHSHDHSHGSGHGSTRVLMTAVGLTLFFAIVEAVAGWWSGSLALISDAGHMVTDSAALAIGAVAAWVSARPPSQRHSYGLKRAEVMGALFNALFMVALVMAIGFAAIDRIQQPQPVKGLAVIGVAALGLLVNVVVAWVLHRGEQNLNLRGAMLHVMGDLLGSVAALAAGVVIWTTGWTPIDPILSLFIALLILVSSLRLLREIIHVLMEGVPRHLDIEHVGEALTRVEGVTEVHDLHVWSLGSSDLALSAHIVIADLQRWPGINAVCHHVLGERFHIHHATLQPELPERVTVVAGLGE